MKNKFTHLLLALTLLMSGAAPVSGQCTDFADRTFEEALAELNGMPLLFENGPIEVCFNTLPDEMGAPTVAPDGNRVTFLDPNNPNIAAFTIMGTSPTGGVSNSSGTGGSIVTLQPNFNYRLVLTPNANATSTSLPVTFSFDNGLTPENPDATATIGNVALPVELLEFTGYNAGKDNVLQWATASEVNNAGFQVQRSAAGTEWVDLGFTAAKNADGAQYEFVDEEPLSGRSLYRLRQVDIDGAASVSNIVAIYTRSVASLVVYPNPVAQFLNIRLEASDTDNAAIARIINQYGAVVLDTPISVQTRLDLSTLPAGTYTLLINQGGQSTARQFIKQ